MAPLDSVDPLNAADVIFEVVDPRSPLVAEALESYFGELLERFDEGFDPGDTITADAHHFEPPHGVFVLARPASGDASAEILGCGAVQVLPDGIAEIKRMWIAPAARGRGLGKMMLHELERHALDLGNGTIRLDTNSALTEAIAMYRSRGYVEIDRYNDNPYARHWFEKRPAV